MNNSIQIARGRQFRVYLHPGLARWPEPKVVISSDESPQVICIEVHSRDTIWDLEIRGKHYGAPCLPIALWEQRSCLVVALDCKLRFLDLESGSTRHEAELPDELYVSDLLVDPAGRRLIVGTARSLLVCNSEFDISMIAQGIASDGVTIVETTSEEFVVACEEPGDTPSYHRYALGKLYGDAAH